VDTRLTIASPALGPNGTLLAHSFTASTSSNSFPSNPLPPLELSCLSFSASFPLFSMLCGLFYQNRGVDIPIPYMAVAPQACKNAH
jgi:hypothetical protein